MPGGAIVGTPRSHWRSARRWRWPSGSTRACSSSTRRWHLRPWAVPGADRLVNIYTSPPDRPRGSAAIGASLAHVRSLDADATLLDGVAATRELSLQFADGDDAPASPAQLVTGNFFRVLTVDMARGRGFLPEEDVPSSPQAVVVLSHRTWQRRFGADERDRGQSCAARQRALHGCWRCAAWLRRNERQGGGGMGAVRLAAAAAPARPVGRTAARPRRPGAAPRSSAGFAPASPRAARPPNSSPSPQPSRGSTGWRPRASR